MGTVDYLPNGDEDLVAWFDNFQAKLPEHAPALGLTTGEVTASGSDSESLRFALEMVRVFRAEMRERTAFKNLLRDGPGGSAAPAVPTVPAMVAPAVIAAPGIVPRLRALVQRIKTHPGYSAVMGQDLGIIAPPDAARTGDRNSAKPTAKGRPLPGGVVEIAWRKQGFTGVAVESQRGDESLWTGLGIDLFSPFRDNRALAVPGVPEVRRYRFRYLVGDNPVGQFSDVVTVTASP